MLYYLLRNAEARIGRFQSAVDHQGRAITRYDAATAQLMGNASASTAEHAWVTALVNSRVPDVISSAGAYLLLSPRAKIVWDRIEHDPAMRFLPTTIVNRRGNRVLD